MDLPYAWDSTSMKVSHLHGRTLNAVLARLLLQGNWKDAMRAIYVLHHKMLSRNYPMLPWQATLAVLRKMDHSGLLMRYFILLNGSIKRDLDQTGIEMICEQLRQGDEQRAHDALVNLLVKSPQGIVPIFNFYLGLVEFGHWDRYRQDGQPAMARNAAREALTYFEQAARVNRSTELAALTYRVELMLQEGRVLEAERCLYQTLSRHPDNQTVLKLLAEFYSSEHIQTMVLQPTSEGNYASQRLDEQPGELDGSSELVYSLAQLSEDTLEVLNDDSTLTLPLDDDDDDDADRDQATQTFLSRSQLYSQSQRYSLSYPGDMSSHTISEGQYGRFCNIPLRLSVVNRYLSRDPFAAPSLVKWWINQMQLVLSQDNFEQTLAKGDAYDRVYARYSCWRLERLLERIEHSSASTREWKALYSAIVDAARQVPTVLDSVWQHRSNWWKRFIDGVIQHGLASFAGSAEWVEQLVYAVAVARLMYGSGFNVPPNVAHTLREIERKENQPYRQEMEHALERLMIHTDCDIQPGFTLHDWIEEWRSFCVKHRVFRTYVDVWILQQLIELAQRGSPKVAEELCTVQHDWEAVYRLFRAALPEHPGDVHRCLRNIDCDTVNELLSIKSARETMHYHKTDASWLLTTSHNTSALAEEVAQQFTLKDATGGSLQNLRPPPLDLQYLSLDDVNLLEEAQLADLWDQHCV